MALQPKDAADLGLSKSAFYRAARAGTYERIGRGIYVPESEQAADWGWIEAVSRRSDATICLTSALAIHDLTDTIPDRLDIAIPRGARIPSSRSTIRWHSFAATTFDLGRDSIPIAGSSLRISIYSPQRCIADAFRLRGALGYELGRDALREWLRRGGKPAELMRIAALLPRARGPILSAMDTIG